MTVSPAVIVVLESGPGSSTMVVSAFTITVFNTVLITNIIMNLYITVHPSILFDIDLVSHWSRGWIKRESARTQALVTRLENIQIERVTSPMPEI